MEIRLPAGVDGIMAEILYHSPQTVVSLETDANEIMPGVSVQTTAPYLPPWVG